MKTLLRLTGALVILVAIGVLAFFFYLDHIARTGIERGGSYALGVPTSLAAADVRPLAGEFRMSGLAVANPPAFDQPHFLELADGHTSVRLGSLREDTVELPDLSLTGLDVYLVGHDGQTNYDAILANLKRFENPDAPAAPAEDGKRFVIRTVDLQDITVHVDMPIKGKQVRVDAPIGRIQLNDVGSDSDKGVLMAELTNIIVKALVTAIIEQSGLPTQVLASLQQGLDGLRPLADAGVDMALDAVEGVRDAVSGALDEAGGKLGDGVGKLGEGLGKGAEDLGAGLTEEADKALKGVGDLLGGSKKDENDQQ